MKRSEELRKIAEGSFEDAPTAATLLLASELAALREQGEKDAIELRELLKTVIERLS